jgi:ribosomal protein S14
MKNLIEKDKKRRYLYANYEKKYLILKYLTQNINLPLQVRQKAQEKLSNLPLHGSKVRLRNRCVLTGRGRSVYKKFRLSRLMFRQLALQGELTGVKKISW